jgi:rubrerythrin
MYASTALVKPRGVVGAGASQRYILAMDEEETKAALDRMLGPGRRIGRRERLKSRAWMCSSCKLTITNDTPIAIPAPCPVCGGIAFETAELPPQ